MNHFLCFIIRGIFNYVNLYKNDKWQLYATAAAAVYTKKLLDIIPAVNIINIFIISKKMEKILTKFEFNIINI
jgi:hypothetical protein